MKSFQSDPLLAMRYLERALACLRLLDDPEIGDGTKAKLWAEVNIAIEQARQRTRL